MQEHPSGCMDVPLLQQMSTDFEQVSGVVVRQQSQWGEVVAQAFGVPWEAVNKYKVSAIPETVAGAGRHSPRQTSVTSYCCVSYAPAVQLNLPERQCSSSKSAARVELHVHQYKLYTAT